VVIPVRSPESEQAPDPSGSRSDSVASVILLTLAIGGAWIPVSSNPWTAVFVAASVLALVPWGWRRTGRTAFDWMVAGVVVLTVLTFSAMAGWDPSRAVGEIGLAAATGALIWLSSRSRPPVVFPALLAAGLAVLAFWGIWQVATGLEAIRPGIEELALPARAYAEERVAGRRAFASFPLPSHLAVMLATALPLLLGQARRTLRGMIWIGFALLAVVGLTMTQSPLGIGLALVAVVPILVKKNRTVLRVLVGGLLVIMAAVIVVRPDVAALEPVSLRIDNWRIGVWLWTTSPSSGVGVASFAQASQAVPLAVGNHPAHAHSLLFEGLAELGPVGLLGLLALGGGLLRLIRSLWRENPGLAMAVAVVPLHNLVDFSLFVPGVALPWAILVGWAAASRTPEIRPTATPSPRGRALLVAAASGCLAMTVLQATGVLVEEASASSPESTIRFSGAMESLGMAPWRVKPQFLLASAAIESGDRLLQDEAWGEIDRRRWIRPRSAALAERRARLALARGDVSSAMSELWAAVRYGSRNSGSEEAIGELLKALDGLDHDSAR